MEFSHSLVVLFVLSVFTFVCAFPLTNADYSDSDQYGGVFDGDIPALLPINLLLQRSAADHLRWNPQRSVKRNIAIGRGDGFRPGK
ncbi:unnamed protein product [Anisakis simplex]|uniref:Uncharacterized protein n=1 Tax=Anisakis simplex TaxID=6269 RepID=A0A0M3J157_ANISI|nr:unnamed protein product [Anisakis simplex]